MQRTFASTAAIALLALASACPAAAQDKRMAGVLAKVLGHHGLATNPIEQRSAQALQKGKAAVAPAPVKQVRQVVDGLMVRFASAEAAARAQRNEAPPADLARQVLESTGFQAEYRRPMGMGMFVFGLARPLELAEGEALAARLRALPAVASVELDVRARTRAVPTDPYFNLQRNLVAPTAQAPGSIDATGAWDVTTGSSSTIVAVLDTGVTNHAEFAGRLLPGQDFLDDQFQANDGDGRDSNADDPGAWVTAAEAAERGCEKTDSNWHGTHVAGILAARGNNGYGVAGVNWQTRILPVRVLGKCGGSTSDVIDGMLWAAGLPVQGVPANPNPAHIINMSLGVYAPQGCSAAFQAAIRQVRARGILIVAAAGNEADEAGRYMPASCDGVISVGAVDAHGFRASYSNFSEQQKITLSAPGGDAKLGDGGWIASTSNTGTTTPAADAFRNMQGTSMAAPHVAGVAALALAANPQLSVQELASLLTVTSHDFQPTSTCAKAWPLCGAGIVNAANMVKAARALVPYRTVVEFYNADYNHYFRTGARDEPSIVESGVMGRWTTTSDPFVAWRDGSQGASPVCRFHSSKFNSHFYTANAAECELIKKNADWTFEEVAFYARLTSQGACAADTVPVHRYYNQRHAQNDGNHRFTTNQANGTALLAKGWKYEGVAFCAAA